LHNYKLVVMKNFALLLSVLLPITNIFAGGGNPPAPPKFPTPPALPIDQYLIPLFILGVVMYIWRLKVKKVN